MLVGKPTKYGTGIEIKGDSLDLNSLYETVTYVAERIDEFSEFNSEQTLLYSFAYDLRKAYQGQRKIIIK